MKKYKNIMLRGLAFLSVLGLFSCEDYLDKSPDSDISSTDAFVSFENFQGFVEELYCAVPDYSTANWACDWILGDEIVEKVDAPWLNTSFDKGNYWAWTNSQWISFLDKSSVVTTQGSREQGLWPNAWYAIRKANLGLENLDNLINANETEKNVIKGQLLFFRAWFHFELMSYWGGLPYIDRLLGSSEVLQEPRLSFQECADKAAADFLQAAELLPDDWDNLGDLVDEGKTVGNNQQRITKMKALGYAGKVFLYAGSPLMNYESQGSKTFNAEYCKKAADVFGEMLKIVDSGTTSLGLLDFSMYDALFFTDGRGTIPGEYNGVREAIFQPIINSTWFKGCAWGPSSLFTAVNAGNGGVSPNARFVENYGMANGLPINDPNSGFDESDPWEGRDPRFYQNIATDGDKITNLNSIEAQLYTGGASRDNGSCSRTGYLLTKLIPITANTTDGFSSNYMHLSYMRLADVYLMYAEAVLQGYGSGTSYAQGTSNFSEYGDFTADSYSLTAEEAFNKIRTRSGASALGAIDATYVTDKDKFQESIVRERAMELAFEGNSRFKDLRRWLLADKNKYKEKTAVDFDRDAVTGKPINIRETILLTRVFDQKHYWLPLKVSDVTLYPSFGQNPGW